MDKIYFSTTTGLKAELSPTVMKSAISHPDTSSYDTVDISNATLYIEKKSAQKKTEPLMEEIKALQNKSDSLKTLLAMSSEDRLKACPTSFPEIFNNSKAQVIKDHVSPVLKKQLKIGKFITGAVGAATIYIGMQIGMHISLIMGLTPLVSLASGILIPKLIFHKNKENTAENTDNILLEKLRSEQTYTEEKLKSSRIKLENLNEQYERATGHRQDEDPQAQQKGTVDLTPDDFIIIDGVKISRKSAGTPSSL